MLLNNIFILLQEISKFKYICIRREPTWGNPMQRHVIITGNKKFDACVRHKEGILKVHQVPYVPFKITVRLESMLDNI